MALWERYINSILQKGRARLSKGKWPSKGPAKVDREQGPAPGTPVSTLRTNITEALPSWLRASLFLEESPVKTSLGWFVLIFHFLPPPDNTQMSFASPVHSPLLSGQEGLRMERPTSMSMTAFHLYQSSTHAHSLSSKHPFSFCLEMFEVW